LDNPHVTLSPPRETRHAYSQQSAHRLEEIYRESSSTLLAEIANLKAIISRFSEFSKMPQPQLQRVQLNDVIHGVGRLFQAQFQSFNRPAITYNLALDEHLEPIAADP